MFNGNKYRPIGISNAKTYQIRTVSKTAVNKRNKKYIKQTVHIHSENNFKSTLKWVHTVIEIDQPTCHSPWWRSAHRVLPGTGRTNRSIPGPGGVPHATPRMPAFPWLGLGFAFGAVNSECDFPNNCSLSLPFVRCIPEINTKAAILSILICLFFLLFIIMLAFISISLPLILINIGHLYDWTAWPAPPAPVTGAIETKPT